MTHAPNVYPQSGEPLSEASQHPAAARVIALTSDLMLSVRLEAPARAIGLAVHTVSAPAAMPSAFEKGPPALVLVDLADPAFPSAETLQEIAHLAPRVPTLGFYPHVRPELGRAAGCTLVLPRSRFFLDIEGSLRAALNASGTPGTSGEPAPAATRGEGSGDTP